MTYDLVSYHGTSPTYLEDLLKGTIDVSKGSGELGQGFYTGEMLYLAKAWAAHKYNRSKAVLSIEMISDNFFDLEPHLLDREKAYELRYEIKSKNTTKTYKFNRNCIWAPIVGRYDDYHICGCGNTSNADQYKWESQKAEDLLNGSQVRRKST